MARNPRTRTHRKRIGGFTLIELMVVVAIIGGVAASGFWILSRQNVARNMRRASNDTLEIFQRARALAIEGNQAVVVDVVNANGSLSTSGSIQAYIMPSNGCAGGAIGSGVPDAEGDPVLLDHESGSTGYRGVVLRSAEPASPLGSGDLRICFLPNGRVVDPATQEPFPTWGTSVFGGRALLEFSNADCNDNGVCTVGSIRRVVTVNFNGLGEMMAPGFQLP